MARTLSTENALDSTRTGASIGLEVLTDHATVQFAADEFAKRLDASGQKVTLGPGGSCVKIGLFADFPSVHSPETPDADLDDAIFVDIREGRGIIAGINPRSVLIAVYRCLGALGWRWVRPGEDGEIRPDAAILQDVFIDEAASFRHRGVCIEGATSLQHVIDMIDWLPKLGFNSYFMQFRESHTFFNRWYSHESNPTLPGQQITSDQAREYTSLIEREIRKRDLIYHKVGHGWTCEPFGIKGLGWDKHDAAPQSIKPYLAQVNGEREWWKGVPLNTNLCYSNKEAQAMVVREIVSYAEEHPEVDVLHFWLADDYNNQCECAECGSTRPSDFYVQMLNKLDGELTKKNLDTRIAALIYLDLLWPPQVEKVENPHRFILMFAPITRTYADTFLSTSPKTENLPPFDRNKLDIPKDIASNFGFLEDWKTRQLTEDSFDFDYHLMWDHLKDAGYMRISRLINSDIRGLREMGINGLMSCQVQRVFSPTGLPMITMGKTLWSSAVSYESVARDYFMHAFGPDHDLCEKYLEELSGLFDSSEFDSAASHIESFLPIIQLRSNLPNQAHSRSWRYLECHASIYKLLAQALAARSRGANECAYSYWSQAKEAAQRLEAEVNSVFDVFEFVVVFEPQFKVE